MQRSHFIEVNDDISVTISISVSGKVHGTSSVKGLLKIM